MKQADFRIYKGDIFPGVEAMLDGIAREFELEREGTKENYDEILTQALVAAATELPRKYWTSKKKKIEPQRSEIFLRGLPIQGME